MSPVWNASPAICDSAIARTHGPVVVVDQCQGSSDGGRAASSSPEFSWTWHSHTSAVRATTLSSSFGELFESRRLSSVAEHREQHR